MMESTGVYKIENMISGKIYIGASKNVRSRWSAHVRDLNSNSHVNSDLQDDWNIFGKDGFSFSLLESSDDDYVFDLEKKWIERLGAIENGYNKISGRPQKMESGRRANLYLDTESVEIAKKLGNGNVSEGIRKALKVAEGKAP